MDRTNDINLLLALSDAPGAPGFEDEVAALVMRHAAPYGDVTNDAMGNVYVTRTGNVSDRRRLTVQLDAHLDEVAFMVRAIMPNGLVAVVPLGHWNEETMAAERVRIWRPNGQSVGGVIASSPPHFKRDAAVCAAPGGLILIDVGTSTGDATRALGVEVGDPVVPDVKATYDASRGLVWGKALDCRSGCYAALQTLALLDGTSLDVDVVAAFSTQEEVGARGAVVTARRIKPDLAIVFEGAPADDTVVAEPLRQTQLGHGPMLRHLDARMVTHPRFQRFALDEAARAGVPVQRAVRQGGATNGGAIHLAACGVPTLVISIPVRYIHTPIGLAARSDHDAAVALAMACLKALNTDVYDRVIRRSRKDKSDYEA